jgi:hypothetical protein
MLMLTRFKIDVILLWEGGEERELAEHGDDLFPSWYFWETKDIDFLFRIHFY